MTPRATPEAISTRTPAVVVASRVVAVFMLTEPRRKSPAPLTETVPDHDNPGSATAPALVSIVMVELTGPTCNDNGRKKVKIRASLPPSVITPFSPEKKRGKKVQY